MQYLCECASHHTNVTRTAADVQLNSSHSLTSAKSHNEAFEDKLSLQPCIFFSSSCQDCVLLCIFTTHGKYWDFHFTSLQKKYFFFAVVCKCSCLHLPCVYHWLLWTPKAGKALRAVRCQVLYIVLCLCVGKVPLI